MPHKRMVIVLDLRELVLYLTKLLYYNLLTSSVTENADC